MTATAVHRRSQLVHGHHPDQLATLCGRVTVSRPAWTTRPGTAQHITCGACLTVLAHHTVRRRKQVPA